MVKLLQRWIPIAFLVLFGVMNNNILVLGPKITCHAFLINDHLPPKRSFVSSTSSTIFAKPPPISNFDLTAVEAFEKELLEKEEVFEKQSNPKCDIDDSDIHEEYEYIRVPSNFHNDRIDVILSSLLVDMSRSQCTSLIGNDKVAISVDKDIIKITRKSEKIPQGTLLRVHNSLVREESGTILAQDLPLDILYEDEDMIILNKAAGMVVHPAAGNWNQTVVNALAYYLCHKSPYGSGDFYQTNDLDNIRPGIVHRLDKGTTGVLVVAKSQTALSALAKAFADRTVKKTYMAITVGNPGSGVVIDKPIGRHPLHRQKMRVVPDSSATRSKPKSTGISQGRNARSFVDTLAFNGKLSVVQVQIETGRTHQIRVHLQNHHTPVYGDDVYGFKEWNKALTKSHGISRPLLHACSIELHHPITGELMAFRAPLASDMAKITNNIWPDAKQIQSDLFSME